MKEFENFYTPEFKKLTCFSYKDFLYTLNQLADGEPFNVLASLQTVEKYFIMADGRQPFFGIHADKFTFIKEELDLDLDLGRCFKSGQEYTMYFNSDPFASLPAEIIVKDEPAIELVLGSEDKPAVAVSKSEDTDKVEPDWAHMESLYDASDKKGSKDALEAYVIETHGVDLAKNKAFPKMLEDLKELLV